VYRWSNERLVRHEIAGTTETTLNFPVGNEHIDVQFVPPKLDSRLVTMRLIESRGVGTSRRSWPLEISASLGSDLQ
jgi:hypothetical protein